MEIVVFCGPKVESNIYKLVARVPVVVFFLIEKVRPRDPIFDSLRSEFKNTEEI